MITRFRDLAHGDSHGGVYFTEQNGSSIKCGAGSIKHGMELILNIWLAHVTPCMHFRITIATDNNTIAINSCIVRIPA